MKTGQIDAICKIIKAHRNRSASATLGYIWREDKCKAKFGIFELGGVTKDITTDAAVLESGHEGRGEVVKHVVLSLRCDWSRKAEGALYCMCLEWIEKFAPGRDWIAGVHTKDGNIHCHLAVRNSGPDGRCLKFKRADLYAMVQMAWTDAATPSKGTTASKTLAFVEARMHGGLAGRSSFEAVRIWAEREVENGRAAVGRRDKLGRLTSIVVGTDRHRLKSVARAVAAMNGRAGSLADPTVMPPRTAAANGPNEPMETSPSAVELESAMSDVRSVVRNLRKRRRRRKPREPQL